MDYEKKDWELNFKDMLFAVLYQWKKILAVAVVLAILLGGYQTWDTLNSTVSEETKAKTLADLETCNRDIWKLETRMTLTQQRIDEQETYLAESVLMQMDARSAYEARASLYITTNYQIMPEMAYQNEDTIESIMVMYTGILNNNDVFAQIAAETGIEAKYLLELVKITKSVKHVLEIRVIHPDSTVAEQIVDLLIMHVDTAKNQVTGQIGEHSVSVVIKTVGVNLDSETISDKQEKASNVLSSLDDDLVKQTEKLDTLLKKQTSLEEKVASQNAAVSLASALKAGILWAVIGGVAGAILWAVLICCRFVFRTSVYSAGELRLRMDVTVLGSVIDRKKKYDVITRFLRKLEGRILENSSENLELIAENVRCYGAKDEKILVVGGADTQMIRELTEQLQQELVGVNIIHGADYLSDAASLRKLKDCDGVILVETCGRSKYGAIGRKLTYIDEMKKHCIGCVVVE